VKGFVTSPGEIEDRFGDVFLVEQLHRSIEPTDDLRIRRMEFDRSPRRPTGCDNDRLRQHSEVLHHRDFGPALL
jgi:hypothetical protein